jgi:hypothetical protein
MSGNIFMTIFFSLILVYLWGMINGLQLVALTCLFSVNLPPVLNAVNTQLMKLSQFDLFQTSTLY